jgi:hypothetical protein
MSDNTDTAINDLGAAIDAAQNRPAGIETHGTSTGVNEGADKIAERGREAEAAYGGGMDTKEAAGKIKQKMAESAASGPTPEDVAAADQEHHRRVAERMGAPDGVDLNKITLTKPDEPITARTAGISIAIVTMPTATPMTKPSNVRPKVGASPITSRITVLQTRIPTKMAMIMNHSLGSLIIGSCRSRFSPPTHTSEASLP